MARDEHEPQKVVADVLVDDRLQLRSLRGRRGGLLLDLVVLAALHLAPPQLVERAVLRRGHEPGAGVVRDPARGPALHRHDQRLLREVLGEPDVAHHAHEAADQPGGFDPPDRLDGLARGAAAHDELRCRSTSACSFACFARSSGESSLPKSSGEKMGRRVTSTPPSNGARLSHSTASSIDLTCQIQ